jgi:hypothetical protein
LLENIHDSDVEGKKLRVVSKFQDLWGTLEQEIEEQTGKFQTDMKNLSKEQKNILIYCESKMREAELTSEKKSSFIIENFVSLNKHKLRTLDE